MRCPFCERLGSPEQVAGNDLTSAIPDAFPISPGHTLIIPRRHVADFFSLSSEEQTAMWQMVGIVKGILDEKHRPHAYNVGINIGDAAGQTIGHAHVHVVPRYAGDVADPRGGVRWIIPSKARYWSREPAGDDLGVIGFAEKMLGLLDEGRFTATYKYAVLLGLMDLCIENTTPSGALTDFGDHGAARRESTGDVLATHLGCANLRSERRAEHPGGDPVRHC